MKNARNTINFTSKPLQIDVTINMICGNQQPIKSIFELLFIINDTSLLASCCKIYNIPNITHSNTCLLSS